MTEQASRITDHGYIRSHVRKDRRAHSNAGPGAYLDLLENRCVSADIAPLLNADAAQEHCVCCNNHVIINNAIVADVRPG